MPSPRDIAPIREKNIPPNHISFHFLQEIQFIYNLMGPLSYMQSAINQNIVIWHMTIISNYSVIILDIKCTPHGNQKENSYRIYTKEKEEKM